VWKFLLTLILLPNAFTHAMFYSCVILPSTRKNMAGLVIDVCLCVSNLQQSLILLTKSSQKGKVGSGATKYA
jgi:hypothetical protein